MVEHYIARSSGLADRALGGAVVVMSANSSLFTLNEVGSAIWNAADGRTPLSQIVEQVSCQQFEVSPRQARADVQEFVKQLVDHGILCLSEQPIPATKSPQLYR